MKIYLGNKYFLFGLKLICFIQTSKYKNFIVFFIDVLKIANKNFNIILKYNRDSLLTATPFVLNYIIRLHDFYFDFSLFAYNLCKTTALVVRKKTDLEQNKIYILWLELCILLLNIFWVYFFFTEKVEKKMK